MPWDSTELWAGSLDTEGVLVSAGRVAGGAGVAVTEPRWGPDGALFYLSDEGGWANLAVLRPGRPARMLMEVNLEFGWPQPVFDRPSFGVTDDGIVVCTWLDQGRGRLATVAPDGRFTALQVEGTAFDQLRVEGRTVVALVDYADRARALVRIDLDRGTATTVRRESTLDLPAGVVPHPDAVSWTNSHGQDVYGLFYPPTHAGYRAPEGELPPLIVRPHSGPTAMSTPSFNLDTVYWTSRGLAVLDVNYGGSTGYGRAYRERLRGNWGIIDVDDCATGARALAEQGRVDGGRLAIRGASAGGFTTLAALTGTDVFAAGASRFGVGDLESLARETHKFESRYLDGLVAPYPEGRDIYLQRSPLHHLDALNAPMILLQGLEDNVVPPSQAQDMADAVRAKGLPVAHLEFAGEGHGFRKAETIIRSREAEAYFYSRVFGYDLADDIQPIIIDNL
jgi:dipeptidyl aminopeptidase/acylaminoacyl peptidase